MTDPQSRTAIIDGREVTFPVEVRDASIATVTVLGSARGAREALAGTGLEPVTPLPGRALWTVAAIDYRDNDLGEYHEIAIAVVVRKKGRSRLGSAADLARARLHTHITHLPVDQRFTYLAGRQLWGFPKTVDQLDFDRVGDQLQVMWSRDDQLILRLSTPASGRHRVPTTSLQTYTVIDGRTHVTDFTMSGQDGSFGSGLGVDLELGDHPVADELRRAGLPGRPMSAIWVGRATGSFGKPEPVD